MSEQTTKGLFEETTILFKVIVDGFDKGPMYLKLTHDLNRISDQKNIATVLHWGPLLPILRGTSYIGAWVIIERYTDGSFYLQITRNL